ncbi:MAG: S41 family peptidase [Desulfococcaceae bacterium]
MEKKTNRGLFRLAAMAALATFLCAGFLPHALAADAEDALQMLSDVIDKLEKQYVDEVDSREMILKGIEEMVASLDAHSRLLPPSAYEELRIDTEGEFGGIGIVLTMEDDKLTVISPIEGTPAFAAGVEAGDVIIAVDGESTEEMMLWEAVQKMRGPKGESVRVTIRREGEEEPIDFDLVRDIIPIVSVKSSPVEPGYGYVRITNFQENTTEDLEAAVDKLEAEGPELEGLILDLRDNPGGLLRQAIGVSDFFLDDGVILSVKGRLPEHTREYKARGSWFKRRNFRLVVLINGGSASASEIVAGAIQDHSRGTILGTPSFGKGSVQTVEPLRDGYGLKFTIYRYYTPSGRAIQNHGIEPDIEVKQRYADGEVDTEAWRLKEKDLDNHLEARPLNGDGKIKEPESPESISPAERRRRRVERRHRPLTPERLKEDYQVMRALEVLQGKEVAADTSR